jgi:asparaginyl-tRNA synthetase
MLSEMSQELPNAKPEATTQDGPRRITIAEAHQHEGKSVEIPGWLYNLRKSGKIVFPLLRDGSGLMQAVAVKSALPEAVFEEIKNLTQESSIILKGRIRKDDRAPGGYEMDIEGVETLQRVPESDPYPITPKDHGVDFLMDHRHLWLRSQRQHSIIRIRHEIIKAVRDYFDSHGFTLVDTPIFTPAACEGTTTLFEVDYFEDEKAYLSQSGQLYSEATAMAFGKVYCFGPTFRAEKSKTRRHLTEFWMVEPEMAFATLDDVKNVAEEMILFIVGRVLENRRADLKVLERDLSKLESIKAPFPRITYDEAVKILQAKGSEIQWGGDFGGTDETILTQQFDRPIMVDRYPSSIKAFYMAPDPQRPEVALGVDVLAPEGYGEIIGGGQRIHDPELLLKRIDEHSLPREAFNWYIDLRKYGTVPHGGFGMGIERCVAWICGLEHVRETIAFPRMLYRLRP